MSIDVANPGDRNVIKKEAEKVLQYKALTTEIQHVWNVKAKVTAALTGATGTVSKVTPAITGATGTVSK